VGDLDDVAYRVDGAGVDRAGVGDDQEGPGPGRAVAGEQPLQGRDVHPSASLVGTSTTRSGAMPMTYAARCTEWWV
jgi:hypothetical protein